jgi:hypothetical protein
MGSLSSRLLSFASVRKNGTRRQERVHRCGAGGGHVALTARIFQLPRGPHHYDRRKRKQPKPRQVVYVVIPYALGPLTPSNALEGSERRA